MTLGHCGLWQAGPSSPQRPLPVSTHGGVLTTAHLKSFGTLNKHFATSTKNMLSKPCDIYRNR